MKKNGFTLIELLAVIVILSVLAVITTPIITSSINASKNAAYERQKEMIVKAAEEYVGENAISYNKNAVCVTKLISEGYLKDDDMKNPSDKNENMKEGCAKTTFNSSGKNYTYEYKKKADCNSISDKDC